MFCMLCMLRSFIPDLTSESFISIVNRQTYFENTLLEIDEIEEMRTT